MVATTIFCTKSKTNVQNKKTVNEIHSAMHLSPCNSMVKRNVRVKTGFSAKHIYIILSKCCSSCTHYIITTEIFDFVGCISFSRKLQLKVIIPPFLHESSEGEVHGPEISKHSRFANLQN